HLSPQLGNLGDRQPGLVRHHDAHRRGEVLVQRRGYLALLRSIHHYSPNSSAAAPKRARGKTIIASAARTTAFRNPTGASPRRGPPHRPSPRVPSSRPG